jgi:uncharacterized Ntn-hydrolase superfamily protein
VDGDDNRLTYGAAVVVPGKGVAACQAATDGTHQNQTIVFEELQKGTDPRQIIDLLSQDPAFQSKQYGILDLEGRVAAHTGLNNGFVAEDMHGQVPNAGALTDRVMAAMEAADASGGDARCTCPPASAGTSAIPCTTKTAHVAYILMAEPTDTNGDSHSNGKYALYLTVSQPDPVPPGAAFTTHGPNQIKIGENLNPVKTLRMRYDVWRKRQPTNFK